MATESLTELSPGERPYHAAYRPRIARDDTPGQPAAGLWIVSVPNRGAGDRPADSLCAYFADLEEAREWATAGWRAVHQLDTGHVTITPAVTYSYDPDDPASAEALRQWEAAVGAPLADAGVSVVTRHWVDPHPVPLPAPRPFNRPYAPDDIDGIAGPRGTPGDLAEGRADPLYEARRRRAAERQRILNVREALADYGVIPSHENPTAAEIQAALERLRDTDAALYQRIQDRVTPPDPQAYAGSQHGYLTDIDDAPGVSNPHLTPWDHTWYLSRLAPDCHVLWRPTNKENPAVFFDTDNRGQAVAGRPGWFPTAEAAREAAMHAASDAGPVTVRPSERIPAHIRIAFYRRHPDALRADGPSAPPPESAVTPRP